MDGCKRFGLALGGGGARGYAHIGVVRVLQREGFKPCAIAGTSMGSIMAAIFAAGHSADEVQELLSQTSFWRFLDINPFDDMLNFSELVRVLEPLLPRRIGGVSHSPGHHRHRPDYRHRGLLPPGGRFPGHPGLHCLSWGHQPHMGGPSAFG